MKNEIVCLLIFIIIIYSVGTVHALSLPLLGKVIYLDPGHGGEDPGAVYAGIYEADINLEIAYKLQEELFKQGAIVYMTRYGDYDLSVTYTNSRKRSDLARRVQVINDSEADLYFSIHLNADSSATWSGAQVFYSPHLEENELLAKSLQDILKETLKTTRTYKEINDAYMYQRIDIPGVLLEVGFLSNANERYLLSTDDYQNKIVEAIVNYSKTYFENVVK